MEERTIDINILDVIRLLKNDKRMIALYIIVGAVIGLVVAFSVPKVYKTTVILAPEETSGGFSGSISSLSAMLGMDFGNTGDAIYPEIYPEVMSSTDFLISLFTIQVTTKDKEYSSDYASYLVNKAKSPWWNFPKEMLAEAVQELRGKDSKFHSEKKVDSFNLTAPEWNVVKRIGKNISCSVDKKTNIITLTVKDQDPYISACVADTIQNRLQMLITDYRTRKVRNDVHYLETVCKEAEEQFHNAQNEYVEYAVGHNMATLETVRQEKERLKSEMQLRKNIYNTVAQQLQVARAKVQERTPAFTTLQSARVPEKKSNMSKSVTLVLSMFLAFLFRCAVLAWKNRKMFIIVSNGGKI